MPCSPDSSGKNSASGGSLSATSDAKSESLCRKLGINPLDLVFWMQNIRIWISQTILARVVAEIDVVNKKLINCGLNDCLVGTVGVERLRKCVVLPQWRDHLTELNNLITFLSVTIHQEYLVKRLRELAEGGALSAFRWNGGGRFKGHEWSDKLPTDAELIMACFAAYMDTRLPVNFRNSHPRDDNARNTATGGSESSASSSGAVGNRIIDDKPFTGVYFITLSETTSQDRRGNGTAMSSLQASQDQTKKPAPLNVSHGIAILQSAERPPHFSLLLNGKERLEISAGRNNIFHTLLFFLHHIKTKESGMLGRINLGVSGVNVLWVIDSHAPEDRRWK
jgi:hypothetical protein